MLIASFCGELNSCQDVSASVWAPRHQKLGIVIFTTFKFPFLPTIALQTCYEQSNNSIRLPSVLQGTVAVGPDSSGA